MFVEEREETHFTWEMIGDIKEGRPNLGDQMSVASYRLMQFTLRDVMIQKLGVEQTDQLFYDAGQSAGKAFYKNIMTEKRDFNKFIEQLQEKLKELKIGILRVEKADMDQLNFTLVVEEDLDCSGLPICGEEVCTYDEGFIHGLLTSFTNREFKVKEIDCWCSGDRVCRFDVKSVPV